MTFLNTTGAIILEKKRYDSDNDTALCILGRKNERESIRPQRAQSMW